MRRFIGLGVALLIGCAIGFLLAEPMSHRLGEPAALAQPAADPGASPDAVMGGEGVGGDGAHSRFAVLARQVAPGVVNVHTSRTVSQQSPGGFPFPDLFGDLFRIPQQQPGGSPAPRRFTVPSLGTGFVISDQGLIVTNYHVVEDVEKIDIVFSDGTHSDAEVVGKDPQTDVALLRAKAKREYVALPLGDSDAMLPGDWVIAIGNPFGLDHTVTAGIVSAIGRDIGQGPYDDFIQTDAAINPGNSGGPLLNLAGQVVGINTAINAQANTIGFAVPINMAKEILPQLEKSGHVVRGWLGVAVQPITPELAEALKLVTQEGALVSEVTPKGPAAQAGFQRGDVIVQFGSKEIHRTRELPRAVAGVTPGTAVDVVILRGGKRETKRVKVGELPAEQQMAEAPSGGSPGDETGSTAFGFDIADVPPALRQRLQLGEREGAVVTQVYPGGPAETAGLQPGDVIVEVDRSPVTGGEDAEAKLRKADASTLALVRREDATLFLVLKRRQE
jgi:serine protease Do